MECAFHYGDPREFPEVSYGPEGSTYVAVLAIQYPPNEIIAIFEPSTLIAP
jgi:hypothetical protein